MTEPVDNTKESGTTTVVVQKKRMGNPNMKAGGKSLNPKGRPKIGTSLSERVRATVNPDELIDFLVNTFQNTEVHPRERLHAASLLCDRGWGKPETNVNVHTTTTAAQALPSNFASLDAATKSQILDDLVINVGGQVHITSGAEGGNDD